MLRIAIFGSGRGSNFMSIVDAIENGAIPVKIVTVIVNKSDAPMIEKARNNYLPVKVISSDNMSRDEHEKRILQHLALVEIDLICLAGYMRILSSNFILQINVPIINIHPSLLPSFPGLNAQQQAYDYGVKITGCTVHQVNEKVDRGRILAQSVVEVRSNDTVETLSARILEQEHLLYPKVLFDIAYGNITLL